MGNIQDTSQAYRTEYTRIRILYGYAEPSCSTDCTSACWLVVTWLNFSEASRKDDIQMGLWIMPSGAIWCYNLPRLSCIWRFVRLEVDRSHARFTEWWDVMMKLQVARTVKILVSHLARLQRNYHKRELKDAQQMVVC